jgi:hypothetical protein
MSVVLLLAACGGTPPSPTDNSTQNARTGTVIPLQNPSFNADAQGQMTGWTKGEHGAADSYTFVADADNAYSAPSSARIKRHGNEPFGLLDQSFKIQPEWRNKSVRLSGMLRSEGANGVGGALIIRVDGGSGEILAWNFMADTRVVGTQEWKHYSIDLKIPPNGTVLQLGVMLEGGGILWADDLLLELLD